MEFGREMQDETEARDMWGINTRTTVGRILATRKKRVLLHFPAGLANKGIDIADGLHREDKDVMAFVWSEPCFGACDVPYFAATALECDLIVTFGHSPMQSSGKDQDEKIPTIFIEPAWQGKARFDPEKLAESVRGYKRIGLVATIQYLEVMKGVKKALEECDHSVVLSEGGMMSPYEGQVTGCDFAAAGNIMKSVDCIVLVSDGSFHTDGLARAVDGKPLVVCDPESGSVVRVEVNADGERKALLRAATFLHSKKVFGIMVSIKPGQKNLKTAERIASLLKARGKTAIILAADSFNPGAVQNFSGIEILVNTACPRMAEDAECFGRPIIQSYDVINACLLK